MKTSTTPTTTTQNSKEKSNASAPSSQTAEPTTPIEKFDHLYDLCTLCEDKDTRDKKTCPQCYGTRFAFTGLLKSQVDKLFKEHKNSRWISVKAELPDDDLEVLVYTYQDKHFLAWIDGDDWHSLEAIFIQDQVTHWKHLTTPTD